MQVLFRCKETVIFICRAPCWQRKASAGSTGQLLFTLKRRGSGILTGVWPPPPYTEEAWLWDVDRSLTASSLHRRGVALEYWQESDRLLLRLKGRGSGMLTGVWPSPPYTEEAWLWNVDRSLTAASLNRRGVALECWQESDRLLLRLKGRGSGMFTGVWPSPPYTEEAWLWNIDRSLTASSLHRRGMALECWQESAGSTGHLHLTLNRRGSGNVDRRCPPTFPHCIRCGDWLESSMTTYRVQCTCIKWICGITIVSSRTFARVTRKTHLWRQEGVSIARREDDASSASERCGHDTARRRWVRGTRKTAFIALHEEHESVWHQEDVFMKRHKEDGSIWPAQEDLFGRSDFACWDLTGHNELAV